MIVKVNGRVIKGLEVSTNDEVMDKEEFINQVVELAEGHKMKASVIPSLAMILPTMLSTQGLADIGTDLREILDPVIELFASLGYPTTYIMIIVGFLMIATGRKSKGLDVIKWACFGYVGISFAPFLLGLLDAIARAMREGLK